MTRRHEAFRHFAARIAHWVGTPTAFAAAVVVILLWVVTGPVFRWSDTWQLVINTGTTIVTFLMVFLIQNTQNRDAKAIHLKLDELIRSTKEARNALVDLEDLTDEELEALAEEFRGVHERAAAVQEELGSRRRGEPHPNHSHGRGRRPRLQ